jgi:hypothetical protein
MKNDLDNVWAYDEPHESGGNAHITMTKRQAIAWMREIFAPRYSVIISDKELFEEWITVHWAYEENEKENK